MEHPIESGQTSVSEVAKVIKKLFSSIQQGVVNIMDDPIGLKRRKWEEFDNWWTAIQCLSIGKINHPFMSNNDTFPSFDRPRGMKIPKEIIIDRIILSDIIPTRFYNNLKPEMKTFFQIKGAVLVFSYRDYLDATVKQKERRIWFGLEKSEEIISPQLA